MRDYIETKRLILRKFNLNDYGALFDLLSDEKTNIFLPWFTLKTSPEVKAFYKERIEKEYKRGGYYFAICLKENNIPIGYINMSKNDAHDVGYALKSEYWNQGITKEAAKAFLSFLKEEGVNFVTATHDINNPNSGKVMKSVGMKYCYSYKERWLPKHKIVIFRMYQMNFDSRNDLIYDKYWHDSEVHFVEDIFDDECYGD